MDLRQSGEDGQWLHSYKSKQSGSDTTATDLSRYHCNLSQLDSDLLTSKYSRTQSRVLEAGNGARLGWNDPLKSCM
jgi:hypothetical protein